MKKEAVGDITRSGGFSRLIRDVETSGEPTIIMKSNAPVAAVLPCPPGMERYLTDSLAIAKAFADLIAEGRDVDGIEFLLHQVALGEFARAFLFGIRVDSSLVRSASDSLAARVGDFARNFVIQENSPEGSGSVSPMTTARAGVSEVKQEELPLGNSSLSRKSGKKPSKKEASSPQKRKIGTKRETSV